MAKHYKLSDEAWTVVVDLFTEIYGRGRPHLSDRLMLDGVLWVLCSGAAWRDMPERFGPLATSKGPLRVQHKSARDFLRRRMAAFYFLMKSRIYHGQYSASWCGCSKIGSDKEISELVCASNLPMGQLRERLDEDLCDRLSHLCVSLPALRDCREDLHEDWQRVWGDCRLDADLPVTAPWSNALAKRMAEPP